MGQKNGIFAPVFLVGTNPAICENSVGRAKIFKVCSVKNTMFWFFSGKKEANKVREETRKSFDLVKKDINEVGKWIKHLHSEKESHKKDIGELKELLSTVKSDVEDLKNFISDIETAEPAGLFKQRPKVLGKQTAVYAVQTGVQTGVQTPKLEHFSVTERAILWVLLNTDLKLSYEDIAAVLGKEKSTIRGQINAIRQKSEGLIHETNEKNNKKRLFIPEIMREKLLKKAKVRVRKR
jgi:septal ring factor EnvC (AmiA/AmiB activator)